MKKWNSKMSAISLKPLSNIPAFTLENRDISIAFTVAESRQRGNTITFVTRFQVPYVSNKEIILPMIRSSQPLRRDAFLRWCDRPAARETFRQHGYVQGSHP